MSYLEKRIAGHVLGNLSPEPLAELPAMIRRVGAEGIVLLKNEKKTLPLAQGERVALFGRSQCEYVKSGTGSGGLVNVPYTTNIRQGLRESGHVMLNEELCQVYDSWLEEHPFDIGHGWATEPWSQVEMPLTEDIVDKAAAESRTALVFIGRTAGEDRDHANEPGSYLLAEEELRMLELVKERFDKVAVILNVGNIIDTAWAEDPRITAVLYVWQGGMEGGRAAADVLIGKVSPSGKLSDTIARSITEYPSHANFGDEVRNFYQEDIYVGYRYFETVAQDRVLYPFGFGLSYTTFETKSYIASHKWELTVTATVRNTGVYAGKEVLQVYYEAPQGKLGQPARQLAAFAKTKLLKPGEEQTVTMKISLADMASYDDSGVTGHKSCYVLEEGEYRIYVGTDVRSAELLFKAVIPKTVVTRWCHEALAPVRSFERMHPVQDPEGHVHMEYEPVPLRTVDLAQRIENGRMKSIPCTEDRGIRLKDVAEGKASLPDFIAQLTDEELCCLVLGEGMSSPKVTPGTGSAFGGLTPGLQAYGIPAVCTTDGPSGIRMDNGAKASSLPGGTLLACTWDTKLVEDLYVLEGLELTAYKIDALLGPGMNIHRHPLCGRNFEYFSEDPVLTGQMAAAMTRGIHQCGATSTLKHFATNNQETKRNFTDSVVSERALREIYLKGYEIAVREGGATSIMTSYNLLNGIHSSSNYDLNTTILRDEWGYTGFVMTDWWALMNDDGGESSRDNVRAMVIAQNDVYMVTPDAMIHKDKLMQSLEAGELSRGDLQRCAVNILNYILQTPAFDRYLHQGASMETFDLSSMKVQAAVNELVSGTEYPLEVAEQGEYILRVTLLADVSPLAQSAVTAYLDEQYAAVFTVNGSPHAVTLTYPVTITGTHPSLKMEFNPDMMRCMKAELMK